MKEWWEELKRKMSCRWSVRLCEQLKEEQHNIMRFDYLGLELSDIPDSKLEAYRNGYTDALYEVGRKLYALDSKEEKS